MALVHEMGMFLKMDVFVVFQYKHPILGEQVVVEDQTHQFVIALAVVRRIGEDEVVLGLMVGEKTEHVRTHGNQFLHVEFERGLADKLDAAEVKVHLSHFGTTA